MRRSSTACALDLSKSVQSSDFLLSEPLHPAGDVTRVSVMPRKVTMKIGDAENRCRGCRDKNR